MKEFNFSIKVKHFQGATSRTYIEWNVAVICWSQENMWNNKLRSSKLCAKSKPILSFKNKNRETNNPMMKKNTKKETQNTTILIQRLEWTSGKLQISSKKRTWRYCEQTLFVMTGKNLMLWSLLETAKKNSEQPQRLCQMNWKEFVNEYFQKDIFDRSRKDVPW